MRTYATANDLQTEVGLELDGVEAKRAIRTASAIVEDAVSNSVYEVDEQGYPTDPEVREVLRLATCLQAKANDENGGSLSLGTQGPSQLGSLRFDGNSGSEAGGGGSSFVDPEVLLLLRNAGLVSAKARVLR